MADKRGNFGSFVMGFIIGGLVSSVISLLNAPQSGRETREQIKTKSLDLRDRADEEIQRMRAQAQDLITEVRTQADDIQAQLAKQIEVVQARMTNAIEEGKKGANVVRAELAGSTTDEAA
ncbi:MAG: YtxH domain-containing protein [Anaerolineae bacterium]|nr:YtxH domain-containing protein [Anaerolineae bacterium]